MDFTSRNTCGYNLAGTETFRRSSRELLGKWGTNLQNLPKRLRRLYIPDEGKILVQVDQSGAEAVIVAYCCENRRYRQLFQHGVKPHVFVGLHIFRKQFESHLGFSLEEACHTAIPDLTSLAKWQEIDRVIKDSDNWPAKERYYFIAKQVCHSSNYGIKANALLMNTMLKSGGAIRLSAVEADTFLRLYHSLFPEISSWHRDVQKALRDTRTLRNFFGYPRQFTGMINDKTFKEAYAFIPQSTVGCITAIAITDAYEKMRYDCPDWDILQDGHDSILAQCPIGEESELAALLQQCLGMPLISHRGERFTMKSEANAGFNWYEMTKIKP